MGKKASRPPASKTSSARAPAASGQTYTGNKSSILRAAFAPSEYQLALFASVIQGLDAQHLRIHDTNTGRLQCEHVLGPKETVTSLDWGYYLRLSKDQQSKKKRKRHSNANGVGLDQGNVVIAFGTSSSEVRMYSPAENKIVASLTNAHDKGVRDFKFTASRWGQEGWSIGGDNKLVHWDLCSGRSTRTINLPASSPFSTLCRPFPSNPPVICASQTPYLINVDNEASPLSFPAMPNPIQAIISSSTESASDGLFLASDNDRFINVFDPKTQSLALNLVAEKEISSLSLSTNSPSLEKQVLAVVTEDGTIELFTKPFIQAKNLQGPKDTTSLKARRQQMTKRAEASIQVTRSEDSDALVAVVTASIQGPDVVVAYAEGGVIPVFERIRLLDEDTEELSFTGTKKVPKTKSSSSVLGSVSTNQGKGAVESQVDESRAVVEQGNFVDGDVEMQDSKQDAASDGESEDYDSDDDHQPKNSGEKKDSRKKREADSDVEMDSAPDRGAEDEDEAEEDEETGEPTFGELMRANASGEVDVEAELDDDAGVGALVPGKPNAAVQQIPTGVSLSTVLTQSLKTNDSGMLESCFHTGDLSIIKTTIQRLDSSLAATLLQRLAERLSSRPGRYGHLLVWVQFTCVAHGGALASIPDLLTRMSTLFKVMDQRSSCLSSLLLLKGKLDMLDAQLSLRQSIRSNAEGMESEDEDNVIYVEGQEDLEDEDNNSDADTAKNAATPRTKSIRDQAYSEDEAMTNGAQSGVDESDNDEGSEDEDDENEPEDENVLDVEAEESAGSSDAEESLEGDEDEDADSAAESEGSMADFIADSEDEVESDIEVPAQPPPSKKTKVQSGGGGGGKGKNKDSGGK